MGRVGGAGFAVGQKQPGKDGTRDGETWGREGVEPGRTRRANRGGLEPRDERRPEVLRKTTSARGTTVGRGHGEEIRDQRRGLYQFLKIPGNELSCPRVPIT